MIMIEPQSWNNCNFYIKKYILNFTEILKNNSCENLLGVYLHGSLAMGSYFPPKSDIDILAVVKEKLTIESAEKMNSETATYSDTRPTVGDIELSVITAETANDIPSKLPYELHYSEYWHDRIINHQIEYGTEQYDTDLFARIMCIKKHGIVLYGKPIADIFGNVNWSDFMNAIFDDFSWILENENICESPYYCILNICRVLHLLSTKSEEYLSKYEGGQWGIKNLPSKYTELIKKAIDVYSSNTPVHLHERKTGGVIWDKGELIAFRDYAKTNNIK
jgi:streptomycin 3"-adenylyltransferase